MGKYQVDLMDGYDSKECVYNEKKEKRYHATIWICILVFVILIFIRGAIWHIEEIYAAFRYQSVEAEYNEKSGYAYYIDAEGRERQCSLDGCEADIRDGKVILYYKEDITDVQPVNTIWFWLKVYLFLGGIIVLCIWRLKKIYK